MSLARSVRDPSASTSGAPPTSGGDAVRADAAADAGAARAGAAADAATAVGEEGGEGRAV